MGEQRSRRMCRCGHLRFHHDPDLGCLKRNTAERRCVCRCYRPETTPMPDPPDRDDPDVAALRDDFDTMPPGEREAFLAGYGSACDIVANTAVQVDALASANGTEPDTARRIEFAAQTIRTVHYTLLATRDLIT